jgi:UDP-glucose:(heptosyl)LPS alpha-1,3-glucosyltransferase
VRIALVRKKYTYFGGAETFSQGFAEELARRGHEVCIFAAKWRQVGAPQNITFKTIPVLALNSFFRELTFALFSYFILKHRRDRFDIIQSHDKTLFQDIYRAGDGCHAEWLRQRAKRVGALKKLSIALNPYHRLILAIERSIFIDRRFKRVLAISLLVKRNIMEHYGVDGSLIDVIYNGVDTERFTPENRALHRWDVRGEHAIGPDEFVLLFVGSDFERKGLKYLLEAAAKVLRPLVVLVAGKGRGDKYAALAGSQRVIFTGPRRDIHRYYAAADAFVFPTLYEPFGNVHLEALASGLPVITTAQSGAAEIIQDGVNGFTVSAPEDLDALRRGMETLMEPTTRASMSQNARRTALGFTFEKHMDEITALYEKVIAMKAADGPKI